MRRALVPLLFALAPAAATAQDRAGAFDHYVLAMTWMPAWCADEGAARGDPRCAEGRRAGWMIHGLWPQNRGGTWPEYCATPERNPSRRETAEQADVFGTSGAAWHQWNKHGRCTGLSAQGYYALTRQVLDDLTLPDIFDQIDRPLNVAPQVIEDAFIDANPSHGPDTMVVTCRGDALTEVRLCLTRDLDPRPCDAELRACRVPAPELLPLR